MLRINLYMFEHLSKKLGLLNLVGYEVFLGVYRGRDTMIFHRWTILLAPFLWDVFNGFL